MPDPSSAHCTRDAGTALPFDGKAFCETLTNKCGVYRMFDKDGKVLYVGKARHLKQRVLSYFGASAQSNPKIRALVAHVQAIEVTVTHTENEALILENNLIKELKPRYNIVLRDDKSYPYIYLSSAQEFPRLSFHRGARTGKGRYFGPYPSAGAVRDSLNLLQKLFLIRSCEDSFFQNRTRPCLLYQIKRCTAPCVGFIDAPSYQDDVRHAVMFLEGRNAEVIEHLVKRMEAAAAALEFERAARYRDQINHLKQIQQRQYISVGNRDLDVIACSAREERACVQIFFIRNGHNLGNKAFFLKNTQGSGVEDILSSFLSQYYLAVRTDRTIPTEILVNHPVRDLGVLMEVFAQQSGRKIVIHSKVQGERARFLQMATENAEIALTQHLTGTKTQQQRLLALQTLLGLNHPIERMECFDISHTRGEATVAACVVFGPEGPITSDHRRFNIEGIEPGDDYAAMHQAIGRRYSRMKREQGTFPDVLLIDGGLGQVRQARDVLASLAITDMRIIGVAKGPSRKPGLETLILSDQERSIRLPPDSPALHLIQQIRDEAHRFAITGHRQRRAKARTTSALEQIAGIGAKRRRQLIQHFGGLQGVAQAGIEDLRKVPGISKQLAIKIYTGFHDSV
jgi:excinuclease ABC subunit C